MSRNRSSCELTTIPMPQCLKVCVRTKKEMEPCRSCDPKFRSKFTALAARGTMALKPCLHHILLQALLCFLKKDALVMLLQGVDHSLSPDGPRSPLSRSRCVSHLLDVCTLFPARAYHSQVLRHVCPCSLPPTDSSLRVSPKHQLRTLGDLEALHYSIRRAD